MPTKSVATALGALTGVVTLLAMLRLVSGAFTGSMSGFALVFCLAAMLPWILYTAWRARRGRLTRVSAAVILGLDVLGLVLVWLFTLGAVAALACALGGFVVIWVSDLPGARGGPGEETFVRIEDLQRDEPD